MTKSSIEMPDGSDEIIYETVIECISWPHGLRYVACIYSGTSITDHKSVATTTRDVLVDQSCGFESPRDALLWAEGWCQCAARPVAVTKPEWIVNDIGELGVKVADALFFLYKGESLQYTDRHADAPTSWRHVGGREFGETCLSPCMVTLDTSEPGWSPMTYKE